MRKRQPSDEATRIRITAEFVRALYEPIAMSPRRIAQRLGFYESSTRTDLAYLEQLGLAKSVAPAKAGRDCRHDRRFHGT